MKKLFLLAFLAFASLPSFAQTSLQGRETDVRAWGAKCDASTNDTAAIQAAITAMATNGGIVNLPDGVCVTTGLSVPGGVWLRGKGKYVTTIKSSTNAVILDLVQGSGSFAFFGPKVTDLAVDGSDSGSSQIGIQVTDATYMRDVVIEDVSVSDCGSHGLSFGLVFSSSFKNIYSNSNQGYPFFVNSPNMPSNYFYGLYAGDISATAPAGYRIKQGTFTCWSCNGVNTNAGSSGYWAVIGGKNGDIDGDTTAYYATASFVDCNIEGAKTAGVLNYPGSVPSFKGLTTFVGLLASSGSWIAVDYDTDASLTPENSQRGYIEDTVIFSNSPASFFSNSQPLRSDGMPPVSVNGRGPKIAGGAYVDTYYNTATSRAERLARVDGYAPVIDITTSTSFTNPGPRAFRVNCGSNCTLTLPSPNFYDKGNEFITVFNLSTTGVIVTIAANGGAAVNGSSYPLSVQGASVILYPDFTSLDWRVVGNRIGAGATNYYALFNSANTITQSGSLIQNSSGSLLFGGTTLYGTDNTIDIGSASDNRPRHIYAATDVISPTFYNVSGGACYKSGSASPEGSVTCEPGSIYLRTNGSWYIKSSGSSNTGWTLVSSGGSGISGSGTTNTLAKFTAATTLGDSLITESTSPNTVTIGARESITGLTINTDATNTVASLTSAATFTKNDTNTRAFDVVRIKPTLNFGGSNTGTTVNFLTIDSTNTATTGATVNLINASYGGSLKFSVDSAGAVTFATGVRQVFVPSSTVASLNFGQVATDPSSGVNGDCVYQTGSNKFRCYENGAWANMIGATPTLTSTQVPFGDGSNLLTSSSAFTYNTSTKVLSIVNGSGATGLTLNGSSDTSNVKFGAASMPGNQGGVFFPFVGGAQSSGPGVWWGSSASYSSLSGLWISFGLNWQGANSSHDPFMIREGTGTSSNGTVRYQWNPSTSLFEETLSTAATGTAFNTHKVTLTSTGTAAANFGAYDLYVLENASGSNVNAVQLSKTWTTATAGAETGKFAVATNLAGLGVGDAFTVDGGQYYGTLWDKGNISGSVTLDFINGNTVTATLTGNVTSLAFSNLRTGGVYFIHFIQNALGPWTLTVPAALKVNGGYTITAGINKRDLLICSATSTTQLYCSKAQDQQ